MSKERDIQAMRRLLIETVWADCQIFGAPTPAAEQLAARIRKTKAGAGDPRPAVKRRSVAFGRAGRRMRFEEAA